VTFNGDGRLITSVAPNIDQSVQNNNGRHAMALYYVNKQAQSNGDHEVHASSCSHLPNVQNKHYLGPFDRCQDAVKEAKKVYPKSNGCYWCSTTCHTT
jgi:hypothetical protein